MIEAIVGSEGAERVLLYLAAKEEGYASAIANAWGMDVSTVQNQLKRMERDGLLVSKVVGKTRLYSFNSRFAFKAEVQVLLQSALNALPEKAYEKLMHDRRRPRRAGKPL